MGTKRIYLLIVIAFLAVSAVTGPGLEDQRKYSTKNMAALDSFIVSSGKLDGLCTNYNAKYTYYDIYLDTPDFALFKNNYSLRFRKRNLGNGLVTYSMQLKSEMDTGSSVRMEVDEAELDFYKIKKDTGWVALEKILDVFYNQLEKGIIDQQAQEIKYATSEVQKWISFKSGSSIAPFQKLLHLNLPGLNATQIKTLRPMIYGFDNRKRSDVYINRDNTKSEYKEIPMNQMAVAEQTTFFKTHPNYNWIMETSLDVAVFYSLIPTEITKADIVEFEVENRFFIPETGKKIMDDFELGLKKDFQVTNERDSKYCRSLKSLKIKQ